MTLTSDRKDTDLNTPQNEDGSGQNKKYLILSDEERSKGYTRPYRDAYVHRTCGATTVMTGKIAETYAVDPKFYGSTWCIKCKCHKPVGEFYWEKQLLSDSEITVGE